MRIGIIGRTEVLFDTMLLLMEQGHEICVIITSKEAPEYTKTADDFSAFARQNGIPFFKTPKINDIVGDIKKLPPIDIGVSMNYAGIIDSPVIDCFRLGILNAHGGDLPRYRGNACQAWAILNGEKRIGLCIHSMIGGELDNGNIIARDYFPLEPNTKIGDVWQWMNGRVPALFCEAVGSLEKNPDYVLEVQSKDPKNALRCYPRTPEDGRIDWSLDAVSILRLINASGPPYSGAFCEWKGEKIVILDAELAPDENYLSVPGQITEIGTDYIDVATGRGKVRLCKILYEEKDITPNSLITSIRSRLK